MPFSQEVCEDHMSCTSLFSALHTFNIQLDYVLIALQLGLQKSFIM